MIKESGFDRKRVTRLPEDSMTQVLKRTRVPGTTLATMVNTAEEKAIAEQHFLRAAVEGGWRRGEILDVASMLFGPLRYTLDELDLGVVISRG